MQRQRCVSFGFVFTGSSGFNREQPGGNEHDGDGELLGHGMRQRQQSGALFNLEIKPKDPPCSMVGP